MVIMLKAMYVFVHCMNYSILMFLKNTLFLWGVGDGADTFLRLHSSFSLNKENIHSINRTYD